MYCNFRAEEEMNGLMYVHGCGSYVCIALGRITRARLKVIDGFPWTRAAAVHTGVDILEWLGSRYSLKLFFFLKKGKGDR
jgi:hypothetical protein